MKYESTHQVQQLIKTLARAPIWSSELLQSTPQNMLLYTQFVSNFDEAQKFLNNNPHLPRSQNLKKTLEAMEKEGISKLRAATTTPKRALRSPKPSFPRANHPSFEKDEALMEAYATAVKKILALADDLSEEELLTSLNKLKEWEKRLPLSLSQTPPSPKMQKLIAQIKQESNLVERVLKRELVERDAMHKPSQTKKQKNNLRKKNVHKVSPPRPKPSATGLRRLMPF